MEKKAIEAYHRVQMTVDRDATEAKHVLGNLAKHPEKTLEATAEVAGGAAETVAGAVGGTLFSETVIGTALGAAATIDGVNNVRSGVLDFKSLAEGKLEQVGTHNSIENALRNKFGEKGGQIYQISSAVLGIVSGNGDSYILDAISDEIDGIKNQIIGVGYVLSPVGSDSNFKVYFDTKEFMPSEFVKEDSSSEGEITHGLDEAQIEAIKSIKKGERPDPSTYLSPEYIESHLNLFKNGVAKIAAQDPNGKIVGGPTGTFVMPKDIADKLIAQSDGDVSKLESLLGLDKGTLGKEPVRIDIDHPDGLRMPSGNELGANHQWIPGGYTSGGIPEAVIDPVGPDKYTVSRIYKK
ncbi:hypothetical protein SAMN04489725_1444 [Alicyclobacillus hesperidum]|uniref:Uncharacterized protein n=1 Tax=Alicyclobacillus hesperidum TaxID=89784 RepID=A0A1H2YKQ5_9BACL|nr:hypothetical protein [Alicyclobacillus hesperidum]SDX05832.1 hypothetical protein SAMN04489725_1444 [Alicyclobacillus hesperidum]